MASLLIHREETVSINHFLGEGVIGEFFICVGLRLQMKLRMLFYSFKAAIFSRYDAEGLCFCFLSFAASAVAVPVAFSVLFLFAPPAEEAPVASLVFIVLSLRCRSKFAASRSFSQVSLSWSCRPAASGKGE